MASMFEILENQSRLYQELLSLAKEKQPVLVKGNLAILEELTKRERELVFKVGRLEEQRMKVHQVLADHFGMSVSELTIPYLTDILEEPLKGQLIGLVQQFTVTLDTLRNCNEINTQLIVQSLSNIDFMVSVLASFDDAPTYQSQPGSNNQQVARLFDKKI
ncbi:MAG: flagellar protein FlgN [Thermincolia bacterium]